MGRSLSIAGWFAVWAGLVAAGCRIPGYEGPVSQSLATSRQFSRRGVAALERGRHQEAEQWLAKAVKACPGDPDARRNYAQTLWERGAKDLAIAQVNEALRHGDDDASLHVQLAQMRLELGQLDAAYQSAERAVDLDPRSVETWAVRSRVLSASGRVRDALADAHRALGLSRENRKILLEVAELYRRLNEPDRALHSLENLAETYDPGEEPQQVLYLTGLAQMALIRYDEAVESFTAAVERGPANADVYGQLAEAQLSVGNLEAATVAAREALQMNPQHLASLDLMTRIDVARQPQTATLR